MFRKNKTSHLALFILISACLTTALGSSTLFADVISANVAPDIQEPAGTYDSNAPTLLSMTAKTVISAGPCVTGDYSGCTLNDVLNDINAHDDFKPEIRVHFTADDYPDDGLLSNAEMRQRGNESRKAPQKSFRIKLDKGLPLWRGERKLQLLKSAFDESRVRNKLSYDLFVDIPHLPSMRTQFVRLTVNDQNVNKDYGLYTQVEYFGKEYLQRRGWDKDSRIYKVENSSLYNDPALALDATGAPVDLAAFEEIFEIKRGDTHFDLINMLNDLNDPSKDFNTEIMGKYFNRDNYLTWLAVNLLINNQDTHFHNYYLYNPKGKDDFYLAPWDYDSSLGMVPDNPEITEARLPRWWFSHANYWEIILHKRFLSEPGNLQLLADAVTEIKNKYLTPDKIAAKRDAYYDIVFPVIRNSPDWNYLYLAYTDPEQVAAYNQIFDKLSQQVEIQYARFMERLYDPMTFKMNTPILSDNFANDGNILFSWGESKSLTGQTIVYDLDVASNREFKPGTILEHITGISGLTYNLHWTHSAGNYFYRVIARDAAAPQQHWQESLDSEMTYPNTWVELHGVRALNVPDNPPSNSISNPAASILVDGNASDWNGLTLFADDPDDISTGNGNIIDWLNAGIAHNDQDIYFLYQNRGPIDPNNASGSYIPWGWQAFLDTDNNPTTGFKINGVVGADYLLEGVNLLKYTGSNNSWNWNIVGSASSRFNGNIEELGFSRNLIGNPSSMRIAFQGANNAYGGNTLDLYPDSGYFSYLLDSVTPPQNTAPVATNQSVSVVKNTRTSISLNATDADGDSLSLTIIQQPAHGVLQGSGLTLQYTPDQNYTGADSFRYRVNDGTIDSNIATVSLTIVNDNTSNAISNRVVNGGIVVNGKKSDWNDLTLFDKDRDDISGRNNQIDWKKAGIAHSDDTIYLLYENHNNVDPSRNKGSFLPWGWQTFLDTDNNPGTGFPIRNGIGADYLIEGRHVFRYNGSGWSWTDLGTATSRFEKKIAELSFPRNWLGPHSLVKVVFLGNNEAFGGDKIDSYPDNGVFEYYFGSGSQGLATPVASGQRGLISSPQNHQPDLSDANTSNPVSSGAGGGGSFSWSLLLVPLFLIRRRLKLSRKSFD